VTYYWTLSDVEKDREDLTRTLPCPSCRARKGARCRYDGRLGSVSHTGRYDLAAQALLVPKMAGA
jgi:hypothetical protein